MTGQPVAPADPHEIRPLPIPPRQSARAESLYEAPVDKAARVQLILCLLREIVRNEGGHANMSCLKRLRGKPAWQHLAELVEPKGLLPFLHRHGAGEFDWDAEGGKLYTIRSRVGQPLAPLPVQDIGQPLAPLPVKDTALNSWVDIQTPQQPVAPLPAYDTSPGQPVAPLPVQDNSNVCWCAGCEAAWLEARWTCPALASGFASSERR